MTNLAGHDMETVLEAFHGAGTEAPTCFIAYTIKGYGLPFAGHKDNHAGLMSPEQMEAPRAWDREGEEWDRSPAWTSPDELRRFLAQVPFAAGPPPARDASDRRARDAPDPRAEGCRPRKASGTAQPAGADPGHSSTGS